MNGYEAGTAKASARETPLKENIGNLKNDLGRLRDDVGGTARDLAGVARSGVHEASEYAKEALDTVRTRSAEAAESARGTVRDHPLVSVGIAFGAGVLLASVLRRI